jgi:hypothetical protein
MCDVLFTIGVISMYVMSSVKQVKISFTQAQMTTIMVTSVSTYHNVNVTVYSGSKAMQKGLKAHSVSTVERNCYTLHYELKFSL